MTACVLALFWHLIGLCLGAQVALSEPARITVFDGTGGTWPVAEKVAEFAEVGVKVKYHNVGELGCNHAPKKKKHARVIYVCETDLPPDRVGDSDAFGMRRMIRLDYAWQDTSDAPGIVCHELMHAVSGIRDNYNTQPDSCVWGNLDHLGSWDVQYLIDHHLAPGNRSGR